MATDYISREAAIALTNQHCFESSYDAEWMEEELKGIPAADVVEVVRCKECLHRCRNGTCEIALAPAFAYVSDTDFCSHGKRRAGNG